MKEFLSPIAVAIVSVFCKFKLIATQSKNDGLKCRKLGKSAKILSPIKVRTIQKERFFLQCVCLHFSGTSLQMYHVKTVE